MDPIRFFAVVSLVALPTVMFGGYSLLRLLVRGGVLSPFQEQFFRAGHAHAGVLLVLSLVYYRYLADTALGDGARWLAGGALLVGILAQSRGLLPAPGGGRPGTGLRGDRADHRRGRAAGGSRALAGLRRGHRPERLTRGRPGPGPYSAALLSPAAGRRRRW
jgi:hypothetical protein